MSKTSKGSEKSGQWLKTQVCDCLKSLERDFMRFCRCHNTFLCYLSKLLMSLIIYFNKFYEALHNKYIKTPFKCYTKKISISYNIFHDIVNSMLFTNSVIIFWKLHMSHFAYACKMRCPLNLVLEKSEYLWFYWTFCIVILDYGLKLHKLSNIPLSCFRND